MDYYIKIEAILHLKPSKQMCSIIDNKEEHQHTIRQSDLKLLDQIISNQRTINLRYAHWASIHVALLVKRGKIIAQATNGFGSRSRGSGYSQSSIHAEKHVLKELGNIHEMRGSVMYVVRISRDPSKEGLSQFVLSKPCAQCVPFLEKCIREYGLKHVYYA